LCVRWLDRLALTACDARQHLAAAHAAPAPLLPPALTENSQPAAVETPAATTVRRRTKRKAEQDGGTAAVVARQQAEAAGAGIEPPSLERQPHPGAAAVREARIAAALFALHPVHTEAVAGVVGLAEVLCAALFLTALLLYVGAAGVDGALAAQAGFAGLQRRLPPGALLAAALAAALCAALSKELGVTVVSAL